MGKRPVVYLGGRISGLSYDEATSKRAEATKYLNALGFDVLDPMRGKDRLKDYANETHDDTKAAEFLGLCFLEIIERDEADIRAADYYLNLTGDSPSWGTGIEMGYAIYDQNITVVSVGNTTPASGWLAELTYVSSSIREACVFIAGCEFGLALSGARQILREAGL